MMLFHFVFLLYVVVNFVQGDVRISSGHNSSVFSELYKDLTALSSPHHTLCFAHSRAGVEDLITHSEQCTQGVIVYGTVLASDELDKINSPVLVLGGSRDGVSPVSQVMLLLFLLIIGDTFLYFAYL